MATIARELPEVEVEPVDYLNVEHGWKSWLFTTDHKRIAFLYLISITLMFFVGGAMAVLFRINLLEPAGVFSPEVYNRLFSMHGIVMVFFPCAVYPCHAGQFSYPDHDWCEGLSLPEN